MIMDLSDNFIDIEWQIQRIKRSSVPWKIRNTSTTNLAINPVLADLVGSRRVVETLGSGEFICTTFEYPLLSNPSFIDRGRSFGFHQGHDTSPQFSCYESESRLRRAQASRLPRVFRNDHARDDGGQHRACDHLLGAVPKISVAHARRLRSD